MKTIYLVHQPDSALESGEENTIGNPATRKGHKDILNVAKRLLNRDMRPDIILSSQVEASVETASVIAEELELPRSVVEVRNELREPDTDNLVNIIRSMDENLESIMLVGHKSTFDDFTGYLSGDNDEHISRGAIACLEVEVDTWKEVDERTGNMKFVIDPDDEPPSTQSQDLVSTKL